MYREIYSLFILLFSSCITTGYMLTLDQLPLVGIGNIENQQSLQKILSSIEAKLHNIETNINKNNDSAEKARKIELLEARINRMEQLTNKKLDTLLDKVEKLEWDGKSSEKKTESRLEHLQAELDSSTRNLDHNIVTVVNHLMNIENSISYVQYNCNLSMQVTKNKTPRAEQHVDVNADTIIGEINHSFAAQIKNVAEKLTKLYENLLQETKALDSVLKNVNNRSATDLHRMLRQFLHKCDIYGAQIKNELEKVSLSQDKLEQDLVVLPEILHKIIDILAHNSSKTYQEIISTQTQLKNHDSRISQKLYYTEQKVLSCQEDNKALRLTLNDVQDFILKEWQSKNVVFLEDIKLYIKSQIENIEAVLEDKTPADVDPITLQKFSKVLELLEQALKNYTEIFSNMDQTNTDICSTLNTQLLNTPYTNSFISRDLLQYICKNVQYKNTETSTKHSDRTEDGLIPDRTNDQHINNTDVHIPKLNITTPNPTTLSSEEIELDPDYEVDEENFND